MIPSETIKKQTYYLDELGLVMTFFSLVWLSLGLVIFQNTTKSQKFSLLLFLLLSGFALSFAMGLRLRREFTYKNMIAIMFWGLPLFIIAFLQVLSSPVARFDTVAAAFFIAVGTAEELFFRGFLFLSFKKFFPPFKKFSALRDFMVYFVNGIIFGIYHTVSYNYNILMMAFPALMGMLFCYIFDASKRLSYPMAIHAVWNIMQSVAAGGVSPI